MRKYFYIFFVLLGIIDNVFASIDPVSESVLAVSGNLLGRRAGRLMVEIETDYLQCYLDQRNQGRKKGITREQNKLLDAFSYTYDKSVSILGQKVVKDSLQEIHGFAGTLLFTSARRINFQNLSYPYFVKNVFSDIYSGTSTANPWDWVFTSLFVATTYGGIMETSRYAHHSGWIKRNPLNELPLFYPSVSFSATAGVYKSLNPNAPPKNVLFAATKAAVITGVGEFAIDKAYKRGYIPETWLEPSKCLLSCVGVSYASGHVGFSLTF